RYAARLNATKSQTYLARTVSSHTGGCSEDEQGASIVSSRGCYAWPMIVTERLLLRRWKAEDLQPYAEICADSEVMRWIGNGSTRSRSECARVTETFEQRWDRSGSRCKHPSDWQRGVPANHGEARHDVRTRHRRSHMSSSRPHVRDGEGGVAPRSADELT